MKPLLTTHSDSHLETMGYSLAPCPDSSFPNPNLVDLEEASKPSTDAVHHTKLLLDEVLTRQRVSLERKVGTRDVPLTSALSGTVLNSCTPDRKRPKSSLSLRSRTSNIIPKQVKQMLRLRHAPVSEIRSSTSHLIDHVTMRKTSDGRTYLQINLDREQMGDLCNPSTYQINNPWPLSGGPRTAEDHSTVNLPVSNPLIRPDKPATNHDVLVSQSRSIDSDGLGIINDYPHLVLKETQSEDRVNTGSQTKCTPVTLFPAPRPATGTAPEELGSSQSSKTRDQQLHEDGRQPNSLKCGQDSNSKTVPTHDFRRCPATPNQPTNPNAMAMEQPTPPSHRSSPPYASRTRPIHHNKQHSSGTAIPMSPRRNGHSKSSSAQSACGSFADDGRSDTSSGIVMNAQSAEFIRAHGFSGYPNSTPRIKPPRPGPAPTRALPSLPEGYDAGNGVKVTKEIERAFPHIVPSPERSIIKIPLRSPARVRRPPALKIVAPSKFHSPSWISATNEVPQCSPQRSTYETPATSGSTALINSSSSAEIDSDTLKHWKRQRAEATKALKKRDLEQARARNHENDHVNPANVDRSMGHNGAMVAPKSNDQLVNSLQPVSADYKDQGTSLGKLNRPHLAKKSKHYLDTIGNSISPILLIAEQEPTGGMLQHGQNVGPSPPSDRLSPQLFLNGISKPKTESSTSHATRPPPSLLPSPMEDNPQNHHSEQTTNPTLFISSPLYSQTNPTSRSPCPNQPSVPTTPIPTIDSRLSDVENLTKTLLSTLERKNLLLEAAVFAFLSSSKGCGAQGNGDNRSSGLSARSEVSGVWEKVLESRLEAMLGLVGEKNWKEEG